MRYPALRVDLDKIEDNTAVIATACRPLGIEVVGVVKACLGEPRVAHAMVAGGAGAIADSRLANLERLSGAALGVPLMMLRQPMRHEVGRVVEITDTCLASEYAAIELLAGAAAAVGKNYNVVAMVETGDLREGVLPSELPDFVRRIASLPSIRVTGIGTNVACLQGAAPTPAMLKQLVNLAVTLRETLGLELPVISGGNSSAWKLIEARAVPQGITQIRVGEAILLGQETTELAAIHGAHQDAITLTAEIIEARSKPIKASSMENRNRAILALGTQDVCQGSLKPLDAGIKLLRRSSDHLVLDVSNSQVPHSVGDTVTVIPSYEALLAAMTSPFVKKKFEGQAGALASQP